MKRLKLFISTTLLLSACGNNPDTSEEKNIPPKTNIEITTVEYGSVNDELELFATTIYLKRNLVTSPIPAFITKVNVRLGDKVKKGEILFELESKERRALGSQNLNLDTSLTNFGIIYVKAPATGIVSTLEKQQTGDYVLEGGQLCTIAESGDLAFQLNVPYEYTQYVKQGKVCKIVLPDNSIHTIVITTPLTSMNLTAQTQTILAKSTESIALPENLIVKVLIGKGSSDDKQILPKICVQSDEMMNEFWVMKLINDSTAIKIPVQIGNKDQNQIEILTPTFGKDDRIVTVGSYGLNDSSLVKINK